MAMNYYFKTVPAATKVLVCNGCGAVMAFYSSPAVLFYGV